jgi:hypothetical protein
VRLSYYWESLEEMRDDYVVFVHLRGSGAGFGDDHAPLDGRYPTSRWRRGEVIREDREVVVPRAFPPGPLVVHVGVWDPGSGRRLPLAEGPAGGAGDRVELLRLRVRPPDA